MPMRTALRWRRSRRTFGRRKAGFKPGDVIARAGQQIVSNPGDVANVVEQARKSGKGNVILLRRRDGRSLFVPLPLG